MPASTSTASRTGRRRLLVVGVVVLAVLAAGAVWVLGGDAPEQVDIADAAADLDADGEATASDSDQDAAAEGGSDDGASGGAGDDGDTDGTTDQATDGDTAGVDGSWVVDTSVGEFSVADTSGTFVGFRIGEELARVGQTEAVGRTPLVEGELTISDGVLTAATFSADLTGIVSDQPRRENAIQRALGTAENPTATFTLLEPVEVDGLAEGEVVEVTAVGELTVARTTNPADVPLQATVVDGVAVVTAAFEVTFADYGVTVPSAPVVIQVDDFGDVELQLYLTRG